MPIYTYQAFGADGKLQKGSYDAASESEVRQYLKSSQLYPKEIKLSRFSAKRAASLTGKVNWKKWLPQRHNYHRQVTHFTRQLETLLGATIPYDKALEMIINQTTDHAFQSILSDIRGRVMEGEHLAEAMGHYPEAFSQMYVSMVRSGENGGTLDMIMRRLADYYETQEKLISRLKSAMIYPIFMMIFGAAVVGFMMIYIVPKITQIFEGRGATLPIPTRILIFLSEALTQHWLLVLLLLVASLSGASYYLKTPQGRRFRDRMELQLPGIKTLVIKVLVLRFCQTLGTLLKSGVDLKSALEISKHVVVNHFFIVELNQLIIDVNNKGIPLSAAMQRVPFFPEYVCQVVAIGEQAAKVDELLEKVAERMQLEVTSTMEALTSLLQPIMILVMGLAVGFIAVSILLPMLNMSQLLSK